MLYEYTTAEPSSALSNSGSHTEGNLIRSSQRPLIGSSVRPVAKFTTIKAEVDLFANMRANRTYDSVQSHYERRT